MTDINVQLSVDFEKVRESISKIANALYKVVNQICTVAKVLYKNVPIEDKRLRKIRHLALYGKNRRIRKKTKQGFIYC